MDTAPLSIVRPIFGDTRASIPLVDLRRQYQPLKHEILQSLENSLEELHLNGGPNVAAFEREFASFVGAESAVAVGSGTDALVLALRALGIGPGDEVITVSHTFAATAASVRMVGAVPIFVDIDPVSYTMDVAALEEAITPRTRAVLAVHIYGQMAPMNHIADIAREHGLLVIEDACQAHGASLYGRSAGTFGDAAAFSFYCSKNLGAYGEAGVVTTMRADVAKKVRLLRDHGSEVRYRHELVGTNSRMDELQATVLRIKLQYLAGWNRQRAAIARAYEERLCDVDEVALPQTVLGAKHVFHLYVIRAEYRDGLRRALAEEEIATGIHYPVPIHLQPAFTAPGEEIRRLAVTECAAEEIVSLPMFPELRPDEIDRICDTIRLHYGKPGL